MSLLKKLGQPARPADETAAPPEQPAAPAVAPRAPASAPPPAARGATPPAPASETVISGDLQDENTMREMLKVSLMIVDRIQATLGSQTELKPSAETERMIRERFAHFYRQVNVTFPEQLVDRLYQMTKDELMGFGPIQPLLNEEKISEVMVNGPSQVFVERKGKITLTDVKFANDEHVLKVIDRIIRPLGRRIDRKWPMVDARLPDGSRVNAIIPPCAIDGPSITIRKFSKNKLTVRDLINFGSMTDEMAEFLRACVVSRLNVVVSGGTGSGKTTLLNVLSNFIPDDERIVTIEDSAELQLAKPHVVRLEAKPADIDGTGRVAIRDLVINSLRMRPERVVIGECRGGETLDMLQAMNTGHDGSLTTLHANTPRDAISRMETMAMMAGMDMPLNVIREQIASAVDLIVQQTRLDDGSRKVTSITEVQGMEGNTVVLQEIFKLVVKGKDREGKIISELKPTGVRPKFTTRLEAHGFKLPPSIFGADVAVGIRR
ncbi:MAG: CpaF family protein [Chloroflexaceae bacterium]|nr:CpaF family protein [Chloroflexaceae bacterium]NJO05964.1 CpaF family protein [Chloroflexaceae bacterium]